MSKDPDILVKVENVSKKFCRSLKKSLWYGVQDIVSDLNPFHDTGSSNPGEDSRIPWWYRQNTVLFADKEVARE